MSRSTQFSTRGGCGLADLAKAASVLTEQLNRPVPATSESMSQRNMTSPKTLVSDDDVEARTTVSEMVCVSKKRQEFPQKLFALLADERHANIISWLPHGRSFFIVRQDLLITQVLPRFLPTMDSQTPIKYPSFLRKLNRW